MVPQPDECESDGDPQHDHLDAAAHLGRFDRADRCSADTAANRSDFVGNPALRFGIS